MKRFTSVFLVFGLCASLASAAPDYNATLRRAEQFYSRAEWPSARAAYETLAVEKPGVATNYVRAIVASLMTDNPQAASQTGLLALEHHVSIDSLFTGVKKESIALGKNSMYENFLLDMKGAAPWLNRAIDRYLLDYYAYRDNPEKMVEAAGELLKYTPENVDFLSVLAQGKLKGGDINGAIDTYKTIVSLQPDNLEALLYLANYNYQLWSGGDKDKAKAALDYAQRAAKHRMTPRLQKIISQLQKK